MSTFPIRAPHAAVWPIAGFGRAIEAVLTMLDVFTEAQQQAIKAHKRFPFADW